MLVALLLLLVFTVKTTGVAVVARISGTLVVITLIGFMMSINNFRLSFDYVRVVVDLFMLLITMCDDNIFTFLNIGNIYNDIIVNITFFMFLLLGCLVALVVLLVMAVRTIMVSMAKVMTTGISSTIGNSYNSCGQEENKELHCYSGTEDFPPYVTEGTADRRRTRNCIVTQVQ